MGSKRVQRQGTKFSQKGLDMPPYMTLRNHTYYFRQSIPQELRSLIGKRGNQKVSGSELPRSRQPLQESRCRGRQSHL